MNSSFPIPILHEASNNETWEWGDLGHYHLWGLPWAYLQSSSKVDHTLKKEKDNKKPKTYTSSHPWNNNKKIVSLKKKVEKHYSSASAIV